MNLTLQLPGLRIVDQALTEFHLLENQVSGVSLSHLLRVVLWPVPAGIALLATAESTPTGAISENREVSDEVSVLFLHGVGGALDGWDTALRHGLAGQAGSARHADSQVDFIGENVDFADLVARTGKLRRHSALELHPLVHSELSNSDRASYFREQQRLREVIADCPELAARPRIPMPIFLPSQMMIRFPWLELRQAGHYRLDDLLRSEIIDRVVERIEAARGKVVLLAHSLGSVVALDTIFARDVRVDLLVTVGSPMGEKGFWATRWQEAQKFPFDRVGSWLNVVNVRDLVPWRRGLSQRFPQAVDAFIEAGTGYNGPGSYHDAATYSGSTPVVRAVADLIARDVIGSRL